MWNGEKTLKKKWWRSCNEEQRKQEMGRVQGRVITQIRNLGQNWGAAASGAEQRLPITLTHARSGGELEVLKNHLNLVKTQTFMRVVR